MKKFYLGMDIGTESVACTDEQYNLLRAKGKDLWVVRLFDEAKDASERRAKRTARRRLQRRKERIKLLQGIFAPYMQDNLFFIRLNNSAFCKEDKVENLKTKFSLFADKNYTDKEFYKKYPTIFHLRNALVKGERLDLRHYYLALHHIVKYRGHFLFEGEDIKDVRNINRLFQNFNSLASEIFVDGQVNFFEDKCVDFKIIATGNKGIKDKKESIYSLFNLTTTESKEWATLFIGGSATPKKLFGKDNEEKYKEMRSICFKNLKDEDFDAKIDEFDEEHFDLLKLARDIYNYIIFEKVLEGYENISESMVAIYKKHHADLKSIKTLLKNSDNKDLYKKIFVSEKETANYVNYVGFNNAKKCTKEDFIAFIKKQLKEISTEDTETLNAILVDIENNVFLPKIINADNGLFPHQINGIELDAILQNLGKYYPEFLEKDFSGYSAVEKIKKIFTFKIPYYVGPLNATGKNAWMERKEGKTDKITPWNFDDVVDKAKSSENFIRRMTNKCTYLHNEDVLPKFSMYYQAFDVLNQINKLNIYGAPISIELKQELFNNVFLKIKKVGLAQIKNYLVMSGKYTSLEIKNVTIDGFDEFVGLKANMSSYVTFKEKFGDLVDTNPEIFENIIFWHTLNTDKKLVEEMVLANYGNVQIIKDNIKWIKGLTSFKEFGRLSKKLICELSGGVDVNTGEVFTILNRLYNTNENFNQLLYGEKYSFNEEINSENVYDKEDVTYEDVKELYVSPMVRRGVWQSLQMVDEYVNVIGKVPDKIFVEVTRKDGDKGDKGRTMSRKKQILDLYKGLGKDWDDINNLLGELNREDMTDSKLRQESLYLYFLQLGRCAYTGERIDIDDLKTGNYNVDHIIPQSLTKDDSLNNKVLAKRIKNEEKSDQYPLPLGFTNQQSFWKVLKDKKLMSDSKYARLVRTKPLTQEDFNAFVNRQLVVTSQTVKAVAELLKRKYESKGTKIVYSKASNVDNFKQKFDIVKCRETNDLHHAKDAYLNIVVGNVFDTKFTSVRDYLYKKADDVWREYNLKRLYDKPIENAWAGIEDIGRIKKIVSKTSMQVTRYAYTNKGGFYNENASSKIAKGYPIKNVFPYNIKSENGVFKYGGYTGVESAYFVALEHKEGKKLKKVILGLPVIEEYSIKGDIIKIKEYFENVMGLKEVNILVSKIKKDTLISYNDTKAYIVGASDSRILFSNAIQWYTSQDVDKYVKSIFKLLNMLKKGAIAKEEQFKEQYVIHTNKKGEDKIIIDKTNNETLYNTIIKQLNLKSYKGVNAYVTLQNTMIEKKEIFNSKSVLDQARLLGNVVEYLRRGGSNGLNLSIIDESSNACCLKVGYNITDVNFAIIHQSPCGLIERIQKV